MDCGSSSFESPSTREECTSSALNRICLPSSHPRAPRGCDIVQVIMETSGTALGDRVMGCCPEELELPRDRPAWSVCVPVGSEGETADGGHTVTLHSGVEVARSAPTLELSWSLDRAWCVPPSVCRVDMQVCVTLFPGSLRPLEIICTDAHANLF